MKQAIEASLALRVLIIIETILVALTISLYFMTLNAADFSGFAVAYAGLAAVLVFLITIAVFIFASTKGWPKRLLKLAGTVVILGFIFYLLPGNH